MGTPLKILNKKKILNPEEIKSQSLTSQEDNKVITNQEIRQYFNTRQARPRNIEGMQEENMYSFLMTYITCCLASSLFILPICVFKSCTDFKLVSFLVSRSCRDCCTVASFLSIPCCSKSLTLFCNLCISSACF